MWNPYPIVPFLILIVSMSLLILIAGSIILIYDLRRMRQENQEGFSSVWYRRPVTQSSLKWIGYGLLGLLSVFGWTIIQSLPRDISTIGLVSILFVFSIGTSVMLNSSPVSGLRNVQQEHGEGFPFVWYRQPKVIRRIGLGIFNCLPVLVMGYLEYGVLAQYFLHRPFPNPYSFIFVPCLFFLLSVALFIYAVFLEELNKRSY